MDDERLDARPEEAVQPENGASAEGAPAGGKPAKVMKETERVRAGGGPFGGGMVAQKPMNFGPSVRRMLRLLSPQRTKVTVLLLAGVISVALSSVGPRVLGRATDIIFSGVIGKMFPAGLTKEEAIAGARAAGQEQIADLLRGVDLVPGVGVDFGAVGEVLLLVMGIYLLSSLLGLDKVERIQERASSTAADFRRKAEARRTLLATEYGDVSPESIRAIEAELSEVSAFVASEALALIDLETSLTDIRETGKLMQEMLDLEQRRSQLLGVDERVAEVRTVAVRARRAWTACACCRWTPMAGCWTGSAGRMPPASTPAMPSPGPSVIPA